MAAHSTRISSATLGKKAHFCDRHHIAGATAALVWHSSGTACAVLSFDGFLPNSAPPTRGFFAFLGRATRPPDHVKGAPWVYAGRTVKLPKAQMAFRKPRSAIIWMATVQMATTAEVG